MKTEKKYPFNVKYAEQRGLEPDDLDVLTKLYNRLHDLLDNPEKAESPPKLVEEVLALEYAMQILWKFSPDSNYHRYWHEIKGCKCPSMDSNDICYWSRGKIINTECPYHGTNPAQTWEEL